MVVRGSQEITQWVRVGRRSRECQSLSSANAAGEVVLLAGEEAGEREQGVRGPANANANT